MDKISLKQRILQIVMTFVSNTSAQSGTETYLVIGMRCSDKDGEPQLHWDVVSKGTLAEEARHHFECSLLQLQCTDCETLFYLSTSILGCPRCGSRSIEICSDEEHHLNMLPWVDGQP